MKTIELQLPYGLLTEEGELFRDVILSEMDGWDEDKLADQAALRSGRAITEILMRKISFVGKEGKTNIKDISKLPLGDRYFALVNLRRLSHGDKYQFSTPCSSCRTSSTFELDLSALEVKHAEEPTQRIFEFKTPSGKEVKHKLLYGEDEQKLTRIGKEKKKELLTMQLFIQVTELDGKKPKIDDLKNLSTSERQFIRNKIEENTAGIDTEVEMICDNCLAEFKSEMPLTKDFFFPTD